MYELHCASVSTQPEIQGKDELNSFIICRNCRLSFLVNVFQKIWLHFKQNRHFKRKYKPVSYPMGTRGYFPGCKTAGV
jgi:hypothetical protein